MIWAYDHATETKTITINSRSRTAMKGSLGGERNAAARAGYQQ